MRAVLLTLVMCLLSSLAPVVAQTALTGATSQAEDSASAETSTQILIDLLQDDEARQELIDQLQGATTAESGAGDSAAAQVEEPMTLGRQISVAVIDVAEDLQRRAKQMWYQATRLPDRADNFMDVLDPQILIAGLSALGFVVFTTYAAYFVLRLICRRISRRLANAAQGHRFLWRAVLSITSSVIDAIIVALSVAAASLAAVYFYGSEEAAIGPVQLNYLTAFYFVSLSYVAVRAVLAPRFDQLRLIPLSGFAARSIWHWLSVSIAVLGYGQLVVVPLIQREAGYLPAFAASSVFGAAIVLYTMRVMWRHRRGVARWMQGGREEANGKLLNGLLEYWHVPVLIYLLFLLVIVILRPGSVLLPILVTSGKLTALVIGWLWLRNLMRRTARRGVRVPNIVAETMPALQRRLNSVLPSIVLFARLLIALVFIGGVLTVMGAIQPSSWFGEDGDAGFLSELLTITVLIAGGATLWLGVASWRTLLTLLFNASTIAIVVICAMSVLAELGVNIAPLLASAGVLGLAIGFGAQKMVQDIITGVFIQFENAINVGDVITVASVTGVVEKLTVRSVSLRDLHGVFHIIPFSSVDMVSNYMRDFAYSVCDMGVAYREDIEEAKQAMFDAFAELKKDEVQANVILGELEWFGILKRVFDERAIEIPFPHQTIYFGEDRKGNAPPIHIRTNKGLVEEPVKVQPVASSAPLSNVPGDTPPGDADDEP